MDLEVLLAAGFALNQLHLCLHCFVRQRKLAVTARREDRGQTFVSADGYERGDCVVVAGSICSQCYAADEDSAESGEDGEPVG